MNAHTEKIRNTTVQAPGRRGPFWAAVLGTVVLLGPSADAVACTVKFRPHVDHAVGSLSEIADVNRDGRLDLVTADGVLLGKGDGTFRQKIGSDTGGQLADLNRDGKLDLVAADGVRLGKGDGTFRPTIGSDTGGQLADLNRDGKLDLVAADGVRLGKGDGTFRPTIGPDNGLPLADLNRDAKLDLVTFECTYDSYVVPYDGGPGYDTCVGVRLGKGDGTFQTALDYNLGEIAGVGYATVADLNRDGKPDLWLGIPPWYDYYVNVVLLGKGDGTFERGVWFGGQPSQPPADLNRDGMLDLVVYSDYDSAVTVMLGKGDGTFQPGVDYPLDYWARDVKVADLNRDGKPDLVSVGSLLSYDPDTDVYEYINIIGVQQGKGDGTFQAKANFATGESPTGVQVADLNRDGKLDVITTNGDGTVSVLLNAGP